MIAQCRVCCKPKFLLAIKAKSQLYFPLMQYSVFNYIRLCVKFPLD